MKKSIIILTIFALIAGSCGQATKKQETIVETAEVETAIELAELQQKGDVYYLNNAPYSGIARKVTNDGNYEEVEEWEMKDGKFHGIYSYRGYGATNGNYRDGKKHGEWIFMDSGERTVGNYINDMKQGEWKYLDHEDVVHSITTYKDDKKIKEWINPITQLIMEGFTILSTTLGDLNLDKYEDKIVVLHKEGEFEDEDAMVPNEVRALLILLGQADGTFKLAARNDNVVSHSYEGGAMGDPFQQVVIKNGYFSVENMGGSRELWTRIITFKYSKQDKDWYLHRDGGDIIDRLDPDNMTTEIKTTKDFGKISFKQFDRSKNYSIE